MSNDKDLFSPLAAGVRCSLRQRGKSFIFFNSPKLQTKEVIRIVSGEVRSLGGVPILVDRKKLNLSFWMIAASLVCYLVFFNDAPVPLSRLGESLGLVAAILLPTWLWVSNRSQGFPIFPCYTLFFFPTYAIPLCRGDSRFVMYSEEEIATGVFTIIGFLLLATVVWWQCTNRNLTPAAKVRALDPSKSTGLMFMLLFGGILFEIFGYLSGEFMGGGYQALRGYAQNGSRLAIFVLFYQMGRRELPQPLVVGTLILCAALVIRQVASTILASSFPVIGLGLVGFFLGSGKVPWKPLFTILAALVLLHSGKSEMRAKYLYGGNIFYGGKDISIQDYPAFFSEWIQKGVYSITRGVSTEGEQIQDTKERTALLPLFLQIQKMSGKDVPFLQGASYEKIPSMLIPRIISKDKSVSHISNMILAVHYGIIDPENIWRVSIAFDLVMESYANYGYLGVAVLAIAIGLFLGFITLLTTGVPLFSFRFLMATLILSAVVGSNNTMGVFVTTSWQGFLALFTMSLVIMKTIPNPLYAKPVVSRKIGNGRSEMEGVASEGARRDGAGDNRESEVGGHPSFISKSQSPDSVRHERPKRFIYGENKND